jgi:hypothetical protein
MAAPGGDPPTDAAKVAETGYAFQDPLPDQKLERDAPAIHAADFPPAHCAAELRQRALPVERDKGPAEGVAVPVRITGEMHGVRFLPPGKKSVYGKLDCRLAVVLDDLARVLARHDVVLVRVDNLYRPRARLPGRRTHSQHRYGLAIDLVSFELGDGSVLSIEDDWHGAVKSPPCGPESRLAEPTPRAIALRNIVCDVARSGIFHHILTPSYNEAHRDHLHLDIKRGEKRWIIE